MVTGKSPIVPMTWATQGQPSSDASEEVVMVTQLDEERKRLWELEKANLEKAHKRYALPSPGVNPLEGSPKCSCGKLGLGRALPTSSTIEG
jgi:hypothetical protein